MDIMQTMKTRRSVRTYQRKPISDAHWSSITAELASLSQAYGVKLALVKNDFQGKKFGTYGIIKNPDAYIVGFCKNEKKALLQAGMALEKAILYCTDLGIGTCWLGGTFKREEFGAALTAAEDELIPAVVSAGYPEESEAFMGKMIRRSAKSATRIPFEQLFFDDDFAHPLAATGDVETALEMVRMGPSASNKQPWRIVKADAQYHFFLQHTPAYATKFAFDMQLLDMGIAMAHFELAMEALNREGSWETLEQSIKQLPSDAEYIISWVERKGGSNG